MALHVVITGDIVNSTKLSYAKEKKITKTFEHIFQGHIFGFYRGDSFQAYIKSPEQALRLTLMCRAFAISLSNDIKKILSDLRVSIGIGKVTTTIKSLKTAKGEAFILSGRAFDEIAKTETRLIITTENKLADEGLKVIAGHINAIFETMTAKQAQVIFELLSGKNQQMIARQLQKSKSTINQLVSSGGWYTIEKLLQHYENIVNQLS